MGKFLFTNDSESCFTEDYWIKYMKEHEIKELEVFEAKPEHGNGYFFCAEYLEIGESGENCGAKWCNSYVPRNGKSGVCQHHRPTYEQTDVKRILRIG